MPLNYRDINLWKGQATSDLKDLQKTERQDTFARHAQQKTDLAQQQSRELAEMYSNHKAALDALNVEYNVRMREYSDSQTEAKQGSGERVAEHNAKVRLLTLVNHMRTNHNFTATEPAEMVKELMSRMENCRSNYFYAGNYEPHRKSAEKEFNTLRSLVVQLGGNVTDIPHVSVFNPAILDEQRKRVAHLHTDGNFADESIKPAFDLNAICEENPVVLTQNPFNDIDPLA